MSTAAGEARFSVMARRKKTSEAVPAEAAESVPAIAPAQPSGMMLRLKQNEFVHGKLCMAGDTFSFSKSEARRRLTTQGFWEIA